ncbi:hypothetical protein Tco_0854227 [Tanacetum coccineum]
MLPEWGRFVIDVKLNRGLKTSNYDQLYAYLKQHKEHANENKMILERYNQQAIDPLAFVSNVSPQQYPIQSSTILQSAYILPVTQFADHTLLDSGITPTDNLIENLTKTVALLFKMAGLLFKMFRVDRTEVKGTMSGEQLQLEIGELRTKLAILILENGVVLNEEQLLFIAVDQCDAFDSDVDEAPIAHTMFMGNLSSADPIYDEAGPSYDSDILYEVQDHDNYIDSVGEYHEYVKDNAVQVIQSNVSSVPNDALMMIINDMHEPSAQYVSVNEQNKVVNESLTAELVRYKKQVEFYEKGQELLKKELYSIKMQLHSTINHNKLIKEEVTTLKNDFKQKENKYLEELLDMKQLKEKVEDK